MRIVSIVVVGVVLLVGGAAALAQTGNGTSHPPEAGGMFTDVPVDHWAYEDIQYLSDRGIITGVPGGQYRGDQALDRYSAAALIARAMRYIQNSPASVTTDDLTRLNNLIIGLSDEVAALRSTSDPTADGSRLEIRVSQNEAAISALQDQIDASGSSDTAQLASRVRNNFILSLTALMMGVIAVALAVIWP